MNKPVWYDFSNHYDKSCVMKGSGRQNNLENKQVAGHKPRPEIRDDLDHREGEEQMNKGDDTTHNEKETKEDHLKEKKNK